jgi:hypothetical protein
MNKFEKLAAMLGGEEATALEERFDSASAAADASAIPPGVYRCLVAKGELNTSRSGTPGYRVTFVVEAGEHQGSRLRLDCWLTERALPMAKRDLQKLGVTSVRQMETPLPPGLVADVTVVRYVDDDQIERNRVRSFVIVDKRVDPTADPDFPSPLAAG